MKWNEDQEKVACLLAKLNANSAAIKKTAQSMEIEFAALNMRVSNHKNIQGNGGLSNIAEQTKRIYKELEGFSEEECLKLFVELTGLKF